MYNSLQYFSFLSKFTANQAGDFQQGAVFAFRFILEFFGPTLFADNEKGALLAYQTRVDIMGCLVFENNTARAGGAVTLDDQSLVSYTTDS